jgi:WD40 repeat protein
VIADADGLVQLWDWASEESPSIELEAHDRAVTTLAFSPDGRLLATGGPDGWVRIWSTSDPSKSVNLAELDHETGVSGVAFSRDAQTLVAVGNDNRISLWGIKSQEETGTGWEDANHEVIEIPSIEAPLQTAVSFEALAMAPDGLTLATSSNRGSVSLWDLNRGAGRGRRLTGHTDDVFLAGFMEEGRILVSASCPRDNCQPVELRQWDLASGQQIGESYILDAYPFAVADKRSMANLDFAFPGIAGAFSPDGRILALAYSNNNIMAWDVATGQLLDRLVPTQTYDPDSSGQRETTIKLVYDASGNYLAAAGCGIECEQGEVRVWDLEDQSLLGRFSTGRANYGIFNAPASFDLSPQGQYLAAGGETGNNMIWDVHKNSEISSLISRYTMSSMAFSPDGQQLATAIPSVSLMLWDAESGEALGTSIPHDWLAFNSLAYSPDGNWIAGGGCVSEASGSLCLGPMLGVIDLMHMQPVGISLEGHGDIVYDVAFSPDGRTLASTSRDGSVILWDIGEGSSVDIACRRANRNFTEEEWRLYFGDEPYRATCFQE